MKIASLPLLGRREFTLLGGLAVAWPLGARAQRVTMPVMGVLGSATATEWAPSVAAFLRGLSEVLCRGPGRRNRIFWAVRGQP
jgi:hypothetical protein